MNLHEISATRLDVGAETTDSVRLLSSERVSHLYFCTYVLLLVVGVVAILYAQIAATFPALGLGMGAPVVRARHLHSAIMLYLCVVPGVSAALGGVLLPRLLGQNHCANNRYALASLCAYWVAAIVLVASVCRGGCDSGILYSTTYPVCSPVASLGVAVGVLLMGISCSLNGIFVIKATANWLLDGPRTRGLPPVAGTVCINGIMHLLLLPVQCLTVTLMFQRHFGVRSFLDPSNGADPILLRQLSWFYLHPLMLVALFPVFGLIDYAVENNLAKRSSEKPPASAVLLYAAIIGAVLGCFTSGIHLLHAGLSPWLSTMTSSLSLFLVVPFGLSFAHIHRKLCAVRKPTSAPVLFASGALLMLGLGICAAVPLAILGVNSALQGTSFLVGQMHLLSSAVCILSVIGGGIVVRGGSQQQTSPASLAEKIGILAAVTLAFTFGLQLLSGISESQHRSWGGITHRRWLALIEFGSVIAGVLLCAVASAYCIAKWAPKRREH